MVTRRLISLAVAAFGLLTCAEAYVKVTPTDSPLEWKVLPWKKHVGCNKELNWAKVYQKTIQEQFLEPRKDYDVSLDLELIYCSNQCIHSETCEVATLKYWSSTKYVECWTSEEKCPSVAASTLYMSTDAVPYLMIRYRPQWEQNRECTGSKIKNLFYHNYYEIETELPSLSHWQSVCWEECAKDVTCKYAQVQYQVLPYYKHAYCDFYGDDCAPRKSLSFYYIAAAAGHVKENMQCNTGFLERVQSGWLVEGLAMTLEQCIKLCNANPLCWYAEYLPVPGGFPICRVYDHTCEPTPSSRNDWSFYMRIGDQIDCVGEWETCDSDCSDSTYYHLKKASQIGGADCDVADGATRTCNYGDGRCAQTQWEEGGGVDIVRVRNAFAALGIQGAETQGCSNGKNNNTIRGHVRLTNGASGEVLVDCENDAVDEVGVMYFGKALTELPEAFVAELALIPKLRELHLYENALTSFPYLNGLTYLEKLHLDGNALTSVPYLSAQLPGLLTLSLVDNALTTLPDLNAFTKLEILYLEGNAITSIPKVVGLATLSYLDLSYNALTTIPDLSTLTQLGSLKLNNNALTSIPDMSALTQLTTLRLENNDLTCTPKIAPGLGPFTTPLAYGKFRADQKAVDGGECPELTPAPVDPPTPSPVDPTPAPVDPTPSPVDPPTPAPVDPTQSEASIFAQITSLETIREYCAAKKANCLSCGAKWNHGQQKCKAGRLKDARLTKCKTYRKNRELCEHLNCMPSLNNKGKAVCIGSNGKTRGKISF